MRPLPTLRDFLLLNAEPVLGYQQVGTEMLTSPGFLGVPLPPSRVTTQLSPPGRAGTVPEELMVRPGGLF